MAWNNPVGYFSSVPFNVHLDRILVLWVKKFHYFRGPSNDHLLTEELDDSGLDIEDCVLSVRSSMCEIH